MNLTEQVLKGDSRAVARAISLVENNGAAAQDMMKRLFLHTGKSVILGITGTPGSGKSTLVDQLIEQLRAEHKKVGIVAVDPSSPFSGGAILGDRIRMMRHSPDPDVFIRSMATRGHLGGLAKATGETIAILEAAGKDYVVVETVGVGQDEVEVVKMADIILVVLIPGAGDDIQAFKAGLMEIADVFVLNKADSPEARRTEQQLRAMLELGGSTKEIPPIIKTVATEGKGIQPLMKEIVRLAGSRDRDAQTARKKRLILWMLRDIINEKIYREVTKHLPGEEIEDYVERIFRRELDPYTIAEKIVSRLKKA